MSQDLRYPIGKFIHQPFSEKVLGEWLIDIKNLPQHLENAVLNLDEYQLNTVYRDGGWTVTQVVHHLADSHMNAYTRFKLGLTETNPTIRPYDEVAWAELEDAKNMPVNISITLLHALHRRWFYLLQSLKIEDFNKTVFHPEHKKEFTLWDLLGMYSWHSRHHVAHITTLRERMKW